MDKLKMLNYDDKFCSKFNLQPISQHYFMFSSSAAEQLQYFATMVSWLLSFQGAQLAAPEEYVNKTDPIRHHTLFLVFYIYIFVTIMGGGRSIPPLSALKAALCYN